MTGKLRKGRAPLREKIGSSRCSGVKRRQLSSISANQGSFSVSHGPPAAHGRDNHGSRATNIQRSILSKDQTSPGGQQLALPKHCLPHRPSSGIPTPARLIPSTQNVSGSMLLDPSNGPMPVSRPPCVSAHAPHLACSQYNKGGNTCVRATTAPPSNAVLALPGSRPWTANLESFSSAQLASRWSVDLPFGNDDGHPAWHSRRGTCSGNPGHLTC